MIQFRNQGWQLDQFAYVAAFSGGGNRTEWEKANPAALNQKLKVYLSKYAPLLFRD